MKFLRRSAAAVAVILAAATALPAQAETAYDHTFTSIDGDPLPLAQYKGKALLVVATATECGNTHQYGPLQTLWEKYKDRGLVVIGVPTNDFGLEPRDNAGIKDFCEANFSVDFPLTEKTAVLDDKAHPFYKWAAKQLGPKSVPGWNFHKYLVDADGKIVDYFSTRVMPQSPELEKAILAGLPK